MDRLIEEQCIPDWDIYLKVVPGIKTRMIDFTSDLIGEPFKYCKGDTEERGYREGTSFLHLFLLTKKQFNLVKGMIEENASKYKKDIAKAKENRAERANLFR